MTRPEITRDAVVAAARGWIGTPYHHQASLQGVGCDCLGLLRGVWREVVGPEPEQAPPYTRDWAEASGRETLLAAAASHLVAIEPEEAGAGDVLLFRWRAGLPAKHCAILSSRDHMIHAHDGAAVTEAALVPWWRRRVAGAFRFPGIASPETERSSEAELRPGEGRVHSGKLASLTPALSLTGEGARCGASTVRTRP